MSDKEPPENDAIEALKKVWTEGYERGRREPHRVEITEADLLLVFSHDCGNPDCPVCRARRIATREGS